MRLQRGSIQPKGFLILQQSTLKKAEIPCSRDPNQEEALQEK